MESMKCVKCGDNRTANCRGCEGSMKLRNLLAIRILKQRLMLLVYFPLSKNNLVKGIQKVQICPLSIGWNFRATLMHGTKVYNALLPRRSADSVHVLKSISQHSKSADTVRPG